MKTITDLRNQLLNLWEDLKDNKIDVNVAKEMNNAAGKAIKSAAVQLEYFRTRQEKPEIPFFE